MQNTFNDTANQPPPTTTATTSTSSGATTSIAAAALTSRSSSSSVGGGGGGGLLNDDDDDDDDRMGFNSLNNQAIADELNELFTRAAAAASAGGNNRGNNRPVAPPPPPLGNHIGGGGFYRPATNSSSQNNLPNVNVLQSRSLSYPVGDGIGGGRGLVQPPSGFLGWSIFLVAFPFRLLMSTAYDLFSFFMSMFERTPAIPHDYDPLANIAEFTIDYNQTFGINHPEFFAGSYSQVSFLTFNFIIFIFKRKEGEGGLSFKNR